MSALLEARARELAEPLKRRVRGAGRDELLAGRRARALEPTPDFDIDVVVTWVDDADPQWLRDRNTFVGRSSAPTGPRDSSSDARFRSLDELRYALRGVDRNMPWVRDVILVTSGQPTPTWLDTSHVRVVNHSSFMEPTALPTFNSHAIESAMWRIQGLAEHFVYLNDDVLVVRPVRPNDLFAPDGRPRVCLTAIPVPVGPIADHESGAVIGARNARALLVEAGLGDAQRLLAHTPHPQRCAIHEELATRFPSTVGMTERSRVRSGDDTPPVFLHTWYALLTGQAEEVAMTSRYVELSTPPGSSRLRMEARRHDVDYLCANLAGDPALPWSQLRAEVHAALEVALPGPSRFER